MISVIEEGKKESMNLLNKSFGDNESLKKAVWDIDQTPSKGDIPYIIRFLKQDEHSDFVQIKSYFSKYYSFKNRNLKVKTPQQFQNFISWTEHLDHIEAIEQQKNSPRKEITFDNTEQEKIAEDNDLVIYRGDSQDRCIKYGQGYSFCIARPAGGNMYNSYRLSKHSSFYFIFFKKIPKTDIHHIMVLDKTKDGFMWTFADNDTKDVSWTEIVSKFPVLEKYKNLFSNTPLSDDEKNIITFLQSFKQNQNLEEFKKVPTHHKIAFLKSGETLNDEIYNYLETNKLWDLINEYVSLGPNLTPFQENSIEKKGGSILRNYLKNRENSIPQLYKNKVYNFNKLDREVEYVKKRMKETQQIVREDINRGKYSISNYKFLIELPEDLPKEVKYLTIMNCNLVSLKNCPESIRGDFHCYNNNLRSLEGSPKSVKGSFNCSDNKNLTSLKGAPETVGDSFYCRNNKLTSLKGAPETVGDSFYCSNNKLTSLEGAPKTVGGNFYCYHNKLTSLEGAPKTVGGNFNCRDNNLTSLEGAPETVGGDFYCSGNPVDFTKEDIKNAMAESKKRNALRAESFKFFFYN